MPGTTKPLFRCVTCDAEIAMRPVFHVGLAFCCAGCAAGGPCVCSYDEEVIDDDGTRHPASSKDASLADDRRLLAPAHR